MKVHYRQSGGVGGLILGCDLDLEQLSQGEAQELARLARQAKITPSEARKSTQGRDLQNYEIVIEEEGNRLRASFDDMNIKPDIAPLLEFLQARARAIPLNK